MPAFKDANQREWLVKLDAPKIAAVRKACELDLAALDGSAMQKLDADPVLLVNVLWELCRGQNEGVSEESFGAALAGDPIEHATTALIEAITDFFPSRKRLLLRSLAEKQAAVTAKGTELFLAKLNDPTLEAEMLTAMEQKLTGELDQLLTRLRGATSSPATVDSAPTG